VISEMERTFRAFLRQLPEDVQHQANAAYRLFRQDPFHPSLQFKRIDPSDPSVWSVRIGKNYRAIGIRERETILWVWIGSHAEYDKRTK